MGLRWKLSISEVFLQIIVGGGALPHGKYFMGGRHYWSPTRYIYMQKKNF